jgi:2-methylcitrate dehydratase PrpD
MQTSDLTSSHAVRSIAAQYAHWTNTLQWRDIPPDVVSQAQHLILDALGIALASGRYPFAQQTMLAMTDLCSSAGPVPVFGMKTHLPARDAALINGLLIHGLDYDDTHLRTVIHPAAPVVPVAFALAEQRGLAGAEVLHAALLGGEVACRIGNMVSPLDAPGHYARGWHITSTCGAFGAAAAAAVGASSAKIGTPSTRATSRRHGEP